MINQVVNFFDARRRASLAKKIAPRIKEKSSMDDWYRFKRFIGRGKIGTDWAPYDLEIWAEVKILVGAKKLSHHESGAGLLPGFTEYFHETSFRDLWLIDRRHKSGTSSLMELRFCRE